AAITEPGDRLRSRREPRLGRLQGGEEADVEITPQAFGRMAAVVPQDGQDATRRARVRDQLGAALFGLRFREIEPLWIKEGPVLNVQRKFEQCAGVSRTKHLRRAVPVPDRLVVTGGRVVCV